MKEITAYQTKDGKQFFSKKQAELHNHALIRNDLFKAFTKAVGACKFSDGNSLTMMGALMNGEWSLSLVKVEEVETPDGVIGKKTHLHSNPGAVIPLDTKA